MSKITESVIEKYVIELLESQGFDYVYGADIELNTDLRPRPLMIRIKMVTSSVKRSSTALPNI
jgi:hypothetical protein